MPSVQWQAETYEILLASSYHFHSLAKDYQTLYENFCLLSYLTDVCNVRIIDRWSEGHKIIDEFKFKQHKNNDWQEQVGYLWKVHKDAFVGILQLNVEYRIGGSREKAGQNVIRVVFSTEKINSVEYIRILIQDEEGWLKEHFSEGQKNIKSGRMSHVHPLKDKEIEYLYQEPIKIRNRKISGQHYSLALQGGGVKGIAYIGAYSALKKHYGDNMKLSSVIGSSAGGILGLGITCGMKPEELKELCVKYLRNIAVRDKKYSRRDEELEKRFFNILKKFLEDYGILDEAVIDKAGHILQDNEFQAALLDVIGEFNPDIKELFAYFQENRQTVSFYGLLMGGLMTGQTLRFIAITTLEKFKQRNNIEGGKNWARDLTLQQFYKYTNIEFTCTGVDLKNHILRFFNHKTTPKLPVSVAVQLTGSFPVAFESQVWKKQWGKYYVHYSNKRKEIDLAGCHITDGGMLANFPLKYLDNEKMREKYFSHVRVKRKEGSEDETVLIGIGLNNIDLKDEEKQKNIQRKVAVLSQTLGRKFTFGMKISLLPNLFKRSLFSVTKTIHLTQQENPYKRLSQIPAFSFGFNLLQTYIASKDNLTEECFQYETYQTVQPERKQQNDLLFGRWDYDKFSDEIFYLAENYRKMIYETMEAEHSTQTILANMDYLLNKLQNMKRTEKNLLNICHLVNSFIIRYCFRRADNLQANEIVNRKFNKKLVLIDIMSRAKLFNHSSITRDIDTLKETISKVKQYFIRAQSGYYGEEEKKLMQIAIQEERQKEEKKIIDLSRQIVIFLQRLKKERKKMHMSASTIYQMFQISDFGFCLQYEKVNQFIEQLKKSSIIMLLVIEEAYRNREQILEYVKRKLYRDYIQQNRLQGKKCGIHLVMESARRSQLYFHEYIKYTRDALADFNKDHNCDLKITSMTGSNYHSLIIFLYASDLPQHIINKEVWQLKSLIQENQMINRDFNEYSWAKINQTKMRQLQDLVWKHRYDIFVELNNELANDVDGSKYGKMKETLEKKVYIYQNSADQIHEALQNSLNYIADSIREVEEKNEKDKDRISSLGQKLSLILNNHQNYWRKNEERSKKTVNFFKFFLSKFSDLLKYIIYSLPLVIQIIMKHLSDSERKEAWKGVIVGELLKAFHIKQYVSQKLSELGLKYNTTLKQFYDLSSKKINISFTAVQSETNSIKFLNYKTKPSMPVWAAIVATTSVPFFYKTFPNRRQWSYDPSDFHQDRLTKGYFTDEKKILNYYQSADILMKHPLELVTNEKIKTIISDQEAEIYLTFNFSDEKFPSLKLIKKMEMQPITSYDLVFKQDNLSLDLFKSVFSVPAIQEKFTTLDLYMSSHDNLIVSIYKQELFMLPIRLSTLDFSKMTNPEKTCMSDLANDSIHQSECVVLEKLRNRKSQEKVLYFRIEKQVFKGKKKFCIRFLSMLNKSKELVERHRIFYKVGNLTPYEQVKTQYLKLDMQKLRYRSSIQLRVDFPVEIEIQGKKILKKYQNSHLLNISKLLSNLEKSFGKTYQFTYNTFNKIQTLLPLEGQYEQKQAYSIELKSFSLTDEKLFFCNNCLGEEFVEIRREGECFNGCGRSKTLILQCGSEDCSAQFCIECKYQLSGEEKVFCFLGHELKKTKSMLERFIEDNEEKLHFTICDFCRDADKIIYRDDQCDIDICVACKRKKLQNK